MNIVVGIIGAALAGFLLSPLLGVPTINSGDFSIGALLISLLGAVILLAIVNLFRRGRARALLPTMAYKVGDIALGHGQRCWEYTVVGHPKGDKAGKSVGAGALRRD